MRGGRLDGETEFFVVNALDRRRGGADDNEAQAGHLVAVTLTSGSHGAGVNPPGRRKEDDQNLVLEAPNAVRRLSPVECERLMSWPDGWTALDGDDTPWGRRYAACGDGVVANVTEWIGRRILSLGGEEA